MTGASLIACDWGTTNLRAWALDDAGAILTARIFPVGVGRLAAGDAARCFREDILPSLGGAGIPALLCGMIGSTLGWTAAPYVDAPASLEDLAAQLVLVDDTDGPVRIVPGVRATGFNGQGDVMRGEETQLFGWMRGAPDRAVGRRLVCHPGTHTKWMQVDDGRLTRFVTAMTGELFALLGQHGVLRTSTLADDPAAFDEGVAAAGEGDALAARLFTARARVVGLGRATETTASYLSGLLVGADVAATPRLLGEATASTVALLGDPRLCGFYARALELRGVDSEVFDGEPAAVAGLSALHRASGLR